VFKTQRLMVHVVCLALGLVSGGVLFSQSQPRSVLAIHHCHQCLDVNELAGLLASVGIQKFPGLLPAVIFETDRTLALQVPSAKHGAHYVLVPKKDIKNIGEIAPEDEPYLLDIFAVAQHLIKVKVLSKYRITTNGPGFQDVTYLHFHLVTE
jgi:scavenger mRNA decapping enzyme DcpS-like protein